MSRTRLTALAAVTVAAALSIAGCGDGGSDSRRIGRRATASSTASTRPGADSGYLLMGRRRTSSPNTTSRWRSSSSPAPSRRSRHCSPAKSTWCRANPSEALLATQKGAKLKFVGSTMPGQNYALYAKPSVGSIGANCPAPLLGISTPTGLPAVVAKAMLLQSGVDPAKVKLVNSRWLAGPLQSGRLRAGSRSRPRHWTTPFRPRRTASRCWPGPRTSCLTSPGTRSSPGRRCSRPEARRGHRTDRRTGRGDPVCRRARGRGGRADRQDAQGGPPTPRRSAPPTGSSTTAVTWP